MVNTIVSFLVFVCGWRVVTPGYQSKSNQVIISLFKCRPRFTCKISKIERNPTLSCTKKINKIVPKVKKVQ